MTKNFIEDLIRLYLGMIDNNHTRSMTIDYWNKCVESNLFPKYWMDRYVLSNRYFTESDIDGFYNILGGNKEKIKKLRDEYLKVKLPVLYKIYVPYSQVSYIKDMISILSLKINKNQEFSILDSIEYVSSKKIIHFLNELIRNGTVSFEIGTCSLYYGKSIKVEEVI